MLKSKILLASALGLTLLGGAAYAQDAATPPAPAPMQAAAPGGVAPPPRAPGAMAAPGGPVGPGGPGADAPPPPPPGGPRHGGPRGPGADMPPPPPPSKAAHFRLDSGPTRLDVACAEDEPMQACADIAMKLLDAAKTLPQPPAGTAMGGAPLGDAPAPVAQP